jgi:hypothetical protein
MKIKFAFLFAVQFFYGIVLFAQDTRQKYLGIEGGMNFMDNEMSGIDKIRGEVSSYGMDNSTSTIKSSMHRSFAGIKSEVFSFNKKFGLSGGIRFSYMNSSIGKDQDFFYWLYQVEGVNTEYLKIKEIDQTTSYLGIPIELRYFPWKPHFFRLFLKVGADLNCRLQSKTDVVFYDDAMNIYQDDVKSFIEQPKSFSSSVSAGGGFRLGGESKPSVSFELNFLDIFLTAETSGMLHPMFGGGFQFNVQLPIK